MTKIINDSTILCEMNLKFPKVENGMGTDNNIEMYAEIDDIIYRITMENNFMIKDVQLTHDKGLILLTDGRIFMSGQPLDKFDKLNNLPSDVFKEVDGLPKVFKMSASSNNIFLLLDDGKLLVYGDNIKKQLGIPQIIDFAYKFIELPDFDDIIDVYSLNDRTFIRRSDKSIWYCGKSLYKSDEYLDMFVKIKAVNDSKHIIFGKECMCVHTYNNQIYYINFKPNYIDWNRELFKWYMNPMNKQNHIDFILIPQYEHNEIKKILFDNKDNLIVLYSTGVVYNYGNIFSEYSLNTPIVVVNKYNERVKVNDMMIVDNELILWLPESLYFNVDKDEYYEDGSDIIKTIATCNDNNIKLLSNNKIYVKGDNKYSQLGAGIRRNIEKYIDINISTENTKDLIIKYLLGIK